jgi:DNA primase
MKPMGELDDLKERIRDANPIAEVIAETIPLRPQGRRLVGAHHTHGSESGTSFHVDPDHGMYHCFNCQEGGDVFT